MSNLNLDVCRYLLRVGVRLSGKTTSQPSLYFSASETMNLKYERAQRIGFPVLVASPMTHTFYTSAFVVVFIF